MTPGRYGIQVDYLNRVIYVGHGVEASFRAVCRNASGSLHVPEGHAGPRAMDALVGYSVVFVPPPPPRWWARLYARAIRIGFWFFRIPYPNANRSRDR